MNPTTLRTFLFVTAGCACIANAQARSEHTSTHQTLHFAGTGTHTLEVRTITGMITVEAYDGKDVEMIIDKTVDADSEDNLREANREVILDTAENASTVQAIVKYPNQAVCGEDNRWARHHDYPHYDVRFDFKIRVPRDTRLQLCAINKGDIAVTGTQGDFDIRSINGHITMTDVGGSGNATTINGPVNASFVTAPQAPSVFKTINGAVIITLPDRLCADLRMKTFNGELLTDFESQLLPVQPVARERSNGMAEYRSTGFTAVRVGSGGPELTLETLNGDVRVLRRPK